MTSWFVSLAPSPGFSAKAATKMAKTPNCSTGRWGVSGLCHAGRNEQMDAGVRVSHLPNEVLACYRENQSPGKPRTSFKVNSKTLVETNLEA